MRARRDPTVPGVLLELVVATALTYELELELVRIGSTALALVVGASIVALAIVAAVLDRNT